jgi:hypothetical protein
VLSACASLDEAAIAETHRLEDAPYYVELRQPQPAPGSCARVLPVTLDPELRQQFGYSGRMQEFTPIVQALNDALVRRKADECVRTFAAPPALPGQPPRVYVGSAESEYAPAEGASQRLPTDRFQPMVMHVERPGAEWKQALAPALGQGGAPFAVQVQLGVSQYMKGYSGVFRKEVVLGTGYRVPIKFLTAEDKPVEVLHLTGVLVDASGQPVRAGAEGIVLRDTPFLAQTVDASRVFDSSELERVLSQARRAELPGAPLALDVALDNLLAQLTRGAVTVPAR